MNEQVTDAPMLELVLDYLRQYGFRILYGPHKHRALADCRVIRISHKMATLRNAAQWQELSQLGYITISSWLRDPHVIRLVHPDWKVDLHDPLSFDKLTTELSFRLGLLSTEG